MENNRNESRPNSRNNEDERLEELGLLGPIGRAARIRDQVDNEYGPSVPDGTISEVEQLGRICGTCGEFIPRIVDTDWAMAGHICPGSMRPRWVRYEQFVARRAARRPRRADASNDRIIEMFPLEVINDEWTAIRQGGQSIDVRRLTAAINNARRHQGHRQLQQIAHERLQDLLDGVYEERIGEPRGDH